MGGKKWFPWKRKIILVEDAKENKANGIRTIVFRGAEWWREIFLQPVVEEVRYDFYFCRCLQALFFSFLLRKLCI